MTSPLTFEERDDLLTLRAWCGRADRPIALSGLLAARLELAPRLVVAVTFAPATARATVFHDRRHVGQWTLGRDGLLHPRRALVRWIEALELPRGTLRAFRLRLEHELLRQLRAGLWRSARAELDRRRAAGLAPPRSVRPAIRGLEAAS